MLVQRGVRMMNYLLRRPLYLLVYSYRYRTVAIRSRIAPKRSPIALLPLSSLALGEPGWPGADVAAVMMMGLGNTCLMLLCCWCCTRTRTVRRRARAYRRTVPRAIRLARISILRGRAAVLACSSAERYQQTLHLPRKHARSAVPLGYAAQAAPE